MASTPSQPPDHLKLVACRSEEPISEDEVKEAVRTFLAGQGFEVEIARGRLRGIDVDARHPDGRRYVIEAKAAKGVTGPQQHNSFLGMLGQLVSRMDDPGATYGLAVPDDGLHRGLLGRLPPHAREALGLVVFWVAQEVGALTVEVDGAGLAPA